MQTDSTTKSQTDGITSTKLNINAPIFEPKNQNLHSNSCDPVWSKIQMSGNIKSTMLVPPQRQYTNSSGNYNYQPYYASISPYHQIKIEYAGPPNGANTFYSVPSGYIDHNVIISPQSQVVSESQATNNIPTSKSPSSVEQNEILNTSQNSTAHSTNDRSIQSLPSGQSLSVGINQSIIIPQNNLSPVMWQSCSQSPSVALIPYYSAPNNLYLIRQPQFNFTTVNPIMISQNKSATKVYIKNRIFNTGDLDLDKLLNDLVKRINPVEEFVFRSKNCRFFVIKSFTEDNIYQSIRHAVWCSTPGGNETLVSAYKEVKSREIANDETTEPHVYLFFSVNGSGYFCGVAEMTSELHSNNSTSIWNQKKWQNKFSINWLYIKDVPNSYLRQIKIESNDNRPVTNCRDATEILPIEKGIEVLKIIHNIHYDTCLLNDFNHDSLRGEKS